MYKKLHVLCFGNSLSAGFFNFGLEYHPYDGKLKETLHSKFPDLKVFTKVEGLPGDLVTFPGSFSLRMENKCTAAKYDWVICLGGTNDLGYGRPADKIYDALQETWQIALDSGAKVLALTIPECQVKSQSLDRRRAEVNASILAHKADGFSAFDLCRAIPYHDSSDEFTERIFDDGLHLTAEGYDLMGTVIAEHLAGLLAAEEAAEGSA